MDDARVKAGTETALSIKMKNKAEIRGFQFDLTQPEGVMAAKGSNGRIQAKLTADRLPEEDEHTLMVTEQADGTLRFLCGSEYMETTLTIGSDEPGPDSDDKPKNGEKWGDVNNDGTVDVADIATIISIMAANARQQMEVEE